MMFLAIIIGTAVLMIVMHELGHYLAFRMFGEAPELLTAISTSSSSNQIDSASE